MTQDLKIMDIVTGTSSNAEAVALFIALDKALSAGDKVKLSLHNCTSMSSSFLNSSFGEIFDKYGMDKIKSSLSLVNFKPSHAVIIKEYFDGLQRMKNK